MTAPRLTQGLVILAMTDDEFIAYLNEPQDNTQTQTDKDNTK